LLAAPLKAGKETILSPLKNTGEYYEFDFEVLKSRAREDVRLFYLCNPHSIVFQHKSKIHAIISIAQVTSSNKITPPV
jgi:bifunctional pyridoxal-dependent enzyme with beta-cystathionase and maltose regulon repressor activities